MDHEGLRQRREIDLLARVPDLGRYVREPSVLAGSHDPGAFGRRDDRGDAVVGKADHVHRVAERAGDDGVLVRDIDTVW